MPKPLSMILHASCVAIDGRAVVLTGASGSGKSALALQLIALGASLVADDRTIVTGSAQGLRAACPERLTGLIEARGVGIMHAPHTPRARVVLAIAMDQAETERLPPPRSVTWCGHMLPLLHNPQASYFPAAIHTYLRMWRDDRFPLLSN